MTGKRIGLNDLHAHTLRHTAATHAIESGTPLHHLRTHLGHAWILTTVGYLQGC